MLDFTLKKNDKVKIFKNNVAYFKNTDKILFEVESSHFELNILNKDIIFVKKDDDSEFTLDSSTKNAMIKLNNPNISFDIEVEYINVDINSNLITISYKLESDDSKTNIEIKLYD